MPQKKRILLSLRIYNTQRLLVTFLAIGGIMLGTIYVFLFNQMAMRGYVLQQETETNSQLLIEKEKISSKIARYETQEFISDAPVTQVMIIPNPKNFAIIRSQELTAKK